MRLIPEIGFVDSIVAYRRHAEDFFNSIDSDIGRQLIPLLLNKAVKQSFDPYQLYIVKRLR
jgi:hypothetical protein